MTTDAKKEVRGSAGNENSLVEKWSERQARLAPIRVARKAALLAEIDEARVKAGLPPLQPPEPITLRPQRLAHHGRLSPRMALIVLRKSRQRDAERDARTRRLAAKAKGLKRYTGTPCAHRHEPLGERLVCNNGCPTCRRLDKARRAAVKLKTGLPSRPEATSSPAACA
jgi:hypothetical protein